MNALAWAVLAACIWGVVPILEKQGLVKVSPFAGLFYRSMGVIIGLFFLTPFLIITKELKPADMRSAILLIISGLLASFAAQICFYNGLKYGEVSRIVPIAGSFPLIAFMLGLVFLGESISVMKVSGCALIISGIWMLKTG